MISERDKMRCLAWTAWNRPRPSCNAHYCCLACAAPEIDASEVQVWSSQSQTAHCPSCGRASLCPTHVLPDQPSRADVWADLRSRWYSSPTDHRLWLIEKHEAGLRDRLRDGDWTGFRAECEAISRVSHLPNAFYVLARLRLAISDEAAAAGRSACNPAIDVLESQLLRFYLRHLADGLERAMRGCIRTARESQEARLRTAREDHDARLKEGARRGREILAVLRCKLAPYGPGGRRNLDSALFGLIRSWRLKLGKDGTMDVMRALKSGLAHHHRYLEIKGNRLESGFTNKLRPLRDDLAGWHGALRADADGAVGTLAAHLLDVGPKFRQQDDALLTLWRGQAGQPAYSLYAARAAERQASVWLSTWRGEGTQVEDLSILQVLDPSDERWKRGDLRVALPDGERIYDVKNTVRSGRHAELTVARKPRVRVKGVGYVGMHTDGWILAEEMPSFRATLAFAAGLGGEPSLRPKLEGTKLSVLGIFNAWTMEAIKGFAAKHAPGVELRDIDLWYAPGPGTGTTMLPPFVFTMPPETWNPAAKIGSNAREQLMQLVDDKPSIVLDLLGMFSTHLRHGETWDQERIWGKHLRERLQLMLEKARTPRLYEVYLCVLQAALDEFQAYFESRDDAALSRMQRLPKLFRYLFFNEDPRRPLGAWDPTECVYHVALALGELSKQAGGIKHLPRFDRLQVSAKGTVSALRAKDGVRLTLLCHCEHCSAWPLIYGHDHSDDHMSMSGRRLPEAWSCDACGRLICSKGHGCHTTPQPVGCPAFRRTGRGNLNSI